MIFPALLSYLFASTVSIENPGIRLELFLKEITKQTGTPFKCVAYLNNEVLGASFKDQSIDILKTQLARVIHGTWEQKEDGWWLVQTSEQKKEEERWVWSERNKMLQHQIDGLRAAAPKAEWSIKEAEKYWRDLKSAKQTTGEAVWTRDQRKALRLQSPESRLCARIASMLTVEMFKEDPLKFNVNRYSPHGLPGHIDLPIGADDAIRQYNNESQLYRSVADSDGSRGTPAHIEVQYYSSDREFIYFHTLNKDWKNVGNYLPSLYLNNIWYEVQGENFVVSKGLNEILQIQGELESGPEAAQVFEKYKSSAIFNEAESTMFNATKRDPLGIIQGRCWIDFSKVSSKPLLVNLKDDEEINRPRLHVPTIKQPNIAVGMMRDDADGWILGRPINPLFNRSWRLDRSIIEEYARLTKVKNTPNFAPILRMSMIQAQIHIQAKGVPNGAFLLDDRRYGGFIPAILGSLSESQLDNCLKGGRIPISALSQSGRELAWISAHEGELNELTPLNIKDPEAYSPFYCLPRGVEGLSFGASIRYEPEFRFETAPSEDSDTTVDLATLAGLLKEAPKTSNLFDQKFKLASKRVFVASAYLGNKSKEETIGEPYEQQDLPTYTWKTLPDSIRQEVLRAMKNPIK